MSFCRTLGNLSVIFQSLGNFSGLYRRLGNSSGSRAYIRQLGQVLCSLSHFLMHCEEKNKELKFLIIVHFQFVQMSKRKWWFSHYVSWMKWLELRPLPHHGIDVYTPAWRWWEESSPHDRWHRGPPPPQTPRWWSPDWPSLSLTHPRTMEDQGADSSLGHP